MSLFMQLFATALNFLGKIHPSSNSLRSSKEKIFMTLQVYRNLIKKKIYKVGVLDFLKLLF